MLSRRSVLRLWHPNTLQSDPRGRGVKEHTNQLKIVSQSSPSRHGHPPAPFDPKKWFRRGSPFKKAPKSSPKYNKTRRQHKKVLDKPTEKTPYARTRHLLGTMVGRSCAPIDTWYRNLLHYFARAPTMSQEGFPNRTGNSKDRHQSADPAVMLRNTTSLPKSTSWEGFIPIPLPPSLGQSRSVYFSPPSRNQDGAKVALQVLKKVSQRFAASLVFFGYLEVLSVWNCGRFLGCLVR